MRRGVRRPSLVRKRQQLLFKTIDRPINSERNRESEIMRERRFNNKRITTLLKKKIAYNLGKL